MYLLASLLYVSASVSMRVSCDWTFVWVSKSNLQLRQFSLSRHSWHKLFVTKSWSGVRRAKKALSILLRFSLKMGCIAWFIKFSSAGALTALVRMMEVLFFVTGLIEVRVVSLLNPETNLLPVIRDTLNTSPLWLISFSGNFSRKSRPRIIW